ncbi:MAG: hypothetical protein UDJ85_00595, partial [Clostridia bacterium]|nr:hypothetical protein [Clostridia bacterium]
MPKNERPCIRNAITFSRLHYGCRVLPFAPEATKTWCKKAWKGVTGKPPVPLQTEANENEEPLARIPRSLFSAFQS